MYTDIWKNQISMENIISPLTRCWWMFSPILCQHWETVGKQKQITETKTLGNGGKTAKLQFTNNRKQILPFFYMTGGKMESLWCSLGKYAVEALFLYSLSEKSTD